MENELSVFVKGDKLYTDSRDVAKMVGKDHAHLMRDISGYIDVMNHNPILDSDDFFIKSSWKKRYYFHRYIYKCFPQYGRKNKRT